MVFHQSQDLTAVKALAGHQPATLYLKASAGSQPVPFTGYITRISPVGMRVAVYSLIAATLKEVFQWNREVAIELQMPSPLGPVASRARIVGVATNYNIQQPPMLFDLDFIELTDEEEQALRDSHPQAVVA